MLEKKVPFCIDHFSIATTHRDRPIDLVTKLGFTTADCYTDRTVHFIFENSYFELCTYQLNTTITWLTQSVPATNLPKVHSYRLSVKGTDPNPMRNALIEGGIETIGEINNPFRQHVRYGEKEGEAGYQTFFIQNYEPFTDILFGCTTHLAKELIVKNANEHLGAIWNEEYSISADELPLYSDFRMPVYGGAVYHESNLRLGRWRLTAGIRFDVEHTSLAYHSRTDMDYFVSKEGGAPAPKRISIDEGNRIAHTYCEVLPKVSLLYAFDEVRNLYISVAKGYKAGGFNTQMFSDILSEKLKWRMAGSQYDEADLMSYEPEYSWNYELGGHFSCMDGAVRGDFAVFYIDVRDQQLTIFPEGQSTGRMMTNAGRTRSVGAEAALQFAPWRSLEINTAYGYTDARFVRYDNGIEDFKDNRIPYAPQHTLSAQAAWTLPTGVKWLGDVVLQAGVRCAGRIWWNEENTLSQPFYALADASVRFEHKHYSLDIWGRNLGGARYDVFYFKSIGNEFVQRGRPRTFGITLNINI